ncbi:MAG: 30S ribosome-binding factor RbfA [Patescibacteria group bacterium]|nr:30S ribosome-binding factor RbfA [Patescibacteria group bacterium]
MPRRIEQLNDQLREELAILIVKEMPLKNGLITVSFVDCATDLKHAKIGISILPEKFSPSVLKKLKKLSGYFSQSLKKKLKIRQIPSFHWTLDTTESQAAKIEEIIKQIKEENPNDQIPMTNQASSLKS